MRSNRLVMELLSPLMWRWRTGQRVLSRVKLPLVAVSLGAVESILLTLP